MNEVKYTKRGQRYSKANPSLNVGSKIELDISRYINVSYGSTVKSKPYGIFISLSGWSSIRKGKEDEDYDLACRRLNKSLRQYLNNTLDDTKYYKGQTIVITDYKSHVMKPNKQTFVSAEITIFQRDIKLLDSLEVKNTVYNIVNGVDVMFQFDNIFQYTKTKKR